jgi:glycosyltransferase involved in cell wall biosynthesis
MIITFVLPGWSIRKPIGGFKVVYEYANRLTERGHTVNVVHPLLLSHGGMRLKEKAKKPALQLANPFLGRDKVKWFDVSPKVNILIVPSPVEENIPDGDVIIATAWQTAEWVNGYSQDKGERYYLIQHYEDWGGPAERVRATWKMPLRKIVIAKWLERLAEEMGENVAAYIPNGLDFERFRILVPIEGREPARVGMLYDPSPWKGPEAGMNALNLVRREVPSLRAIVFGKYRKGRDVPDWVDFRRNPPQCRIPQIYNDCSIFLHSSRTEGWPLPPAEAMACGCALVTTGNNGVLDYAVHAETALVSEIDDPIALARNILMLIQDDHLRVSMAVRGNRHIRKFTWERAVASLEEVITQSRTKVT